MWKIIRNITYLMVDRLPVIVLDSKNLFRKETKTSYSSIAGGLRIYDLADSVPPWLSKSLKEIPFFKVVKILRPLYSAAPFPAPGYSAARHSATTVAKAFGGHVRFSPSSCG